MGLQKYREAKGSAGAAYIMEEPVITSASNAQIKLLRKLAKSSKERREANLYIAEGAHLAQSFLSSSKVPKMYIIAQSAQQNHEVAELVEELRTTPAKKVVVSDDIFESFSNIHATSGICIVFEIPELASQDILPLSTDAILLEGIQDPGNLGTVLRTAAAVGIQRVLLSPECTSPWSPKALRAGMGAQFSLDIFEDADLGQIVSTAEVNTVATVLGSDSISLFSFDLKQPTAWLFGSEGQGLSETLASFAKTRVMIPQETNTVESLNVAAAATVCLYEQYRQKIE